MVALIEKKYSMKRETERRRARHGPEVLVYLAPMTSPHALALSDRLFEAIEDYQFSGAKSDTL